MFKVSTDGSEFAVIAWGSGLLNPSLPISQYVFQKPRPWKTKNTEEKPLHNKLVLLSSSSGVLQMDTFSLLVFWKTSCHWLKTPVDFDCMWIGVLHCTCYNLVFWKTSCHWLKTPVDFDCMWIGVLHCTCYNLVTTVTTSKNLPNQGSQPIRCET